MYMQSHCLVTGMVMLMGIEVAAVVLFYYFPIFRIFMLLVGFVFIALCKSLILSKIFERYEPEGSENGQQP